MAGRGRPKTGGRQAGTPNKYSLEAKEAAQKFGQAALDELARLMTTSESDSVRVAACNAILDRAYGKPLAAQIAHTGKDENAIQTQDISMLELARRTAFLAVLGDRELKQEEQGTEH